MKAKKLTRFLCLLLVAVMMIAVLAGCKKSNGDGEAESNSSESEDVSVSDESEIPTRKWDDLPDTDYNKKEFRIMGRQCGVWTTSDLICENMGETLDAAIFSRNEAVQSRHNVKISASLNSDTNIPKLIGAQLLVGECDYDLYDLPISVWGQNMLEGAFADLTDISLLNLQEDFWDTNFVNSMTMYDQLYGVICDATYIDKLATWVVLFNTEMIDEYKIEENLYDMVDDGSWTISAMKELGKRVNTDLDKDGNMELEEGDVYAICGETYNLDMFYQASGISFVSYDGTKINSNILTDTTLANNIFTEVYDLIANSTFAYCADNTATNDRHAIGRTFFQKQQSLFFVSGVINMTTYFQSNEHDYGVLPIPKTSNDQDRYYCGLSNYGCPVFGIPYNAKDAEMSATVLQALACRGDSHVNPIFYDKVLKGQASRDSDTWRMLDIIFDSRIYDVDKVFDFGNLAKDLRELIKLGKKDEFSSTVAGAQTAFTADVDNVIAFFDKNYNS